MIRFLSEILKKHTKLAKIIKISEIFNRLVFPLNFNRFCHPMTVQMEDVHSGPLLFHFIQFLGKSGQIIYWHFLPGYGRPRLRNPGSTTDFVLRKPRFNIRIPSICSIHYYFIPYDAQTIIKTHFIKNFIKRRNTVHSVQTICHKRSLHVIH